MKHVWKTIALLLIASLFHALADANTPTDEVVKQQFAKQSGGIMRLASVTLKQLDSMGNQATYMLEGDMASRTISIFELALPGITFFMKEPGPKGVR
ncbi:uncharacterized protein DUF1202 [Klebsiella oxytoca]|uniref:Uncharacterized protein DUF1202 n=1 Tax=Klebsiella oxytoca TaxID=571 RepID=A0A318FWM3_KLEOX|nr:DUF1202 family protein [Klebsiella oxytoca]PXW47884.1 uncharacterized protein DUF1202 [Klebsiella oxytoca]